MKMLGRHLIAEFANCDNCRLTDADFLKDCLEEAVRKSGATLVRSVFHRYNPQGISGVVVIAESHLSIHTWPEYNYAAVDFFTCGDTVDPYKAYDHMREMLASKDAHVYELKRGIPSETDTVLAHKPAPIQSNNAVTLR